MSFGLGFGFPRNWPFAGGPSLNFQFAGSTALDPQITFTRASTATYFDSAGVLQSAAINVPRLDYNPATLAARGLLIEEQRTNLLTYSQDLSNAVWTFTGQLPFGSGSIVDDGIAPDGTTTADKVVEDTSTGAHLINYSNITTSTTTTNSQSFFIKAAGRTSLSIRFGSQGIANRMQADINLNTGAVTAVQNIGTATGATCTATLLPNQWWKITASVNPNDAAATAMRFIIYPNGTTNYTGDGVSGVYIWGAQVEAGAFATSYIPTTTTALTRSADVASVNTLTPWYNATEGTILVEASPQASNVSSLITAEINSSVTDRISLAKLITTGNASLAVLVANVTQASTNSGAWTSTGKMAGAYKLNDFASSLNGSAAATDTSGTIPTVTQLTLGRRADGVNILNGHLRRITYYPRRLSNAELQAITA